MEVLCMNGSSMSVSSLAEARHRVAKALSVPGEAVRLCCEGQVLRLEDEVQGTVVALVDQERLVFAKHWAKVLEAVEALRRHGALVEEMAAVQKKWCKALDVCAFGAGRALDGCRNALKEGHLSLAEERRMVSRLAKLERFKAREEEFGDAKRLEYKLRRAVYDVAECCSKSLEKELLAQGSDPQPLLAELNARASDGLCWPSMDSDDDWISVDPSRFLDLADSVEACPRTWRRETWTKKAGKAAKVWKHR